MPRFTPQYKLLHNIADRLTSIAIADLLSGFRAFRKRIDLNRVMSLIEAGKLEALQGALPWDKLPVDLEPFSKTARKGLVEAAYATKAPFEKIISKLLPTVRGKPELQFRPDNPRIARFLQNNIANLVDQVTSSAQQTVRDSINRAIRYNLTPGEIVDDIKKIGLHPRQMTAVNNVRLKAIDRGIKSGLSYDKARLEARKVADRYAERALTYRAERIANTEMIRAVNGGQYEIWETARDMGIMPDTARVVWIVTPDDKLCPYCEDLGGKTVEMNGTFISRPKDDDGEQRDEIIAIYPPAHPSCRCVVGLEF